MSDRRPDARKLEHVVPPVLAAELEDAPAVVAHRELFDARSGQSGVYLASSEE